MSVTNTLLVLVGFLQFGAIVGQIVIYCRQAEIMTRQLASMRLAGRTARRVAETLPTVEKAYIFPSVRAYPGVLNGAGANITVHRTMGPKPNIFEIQINNYGKTPGQLIEIHFGFFDGPVPKNIPPIYIDNIRFVAEWVRPEADEPIKYYNKILPEMNTPIIFGRIYYRDVVLKRLHSIGFIYEITDWEGARGIRAPQAYTESREENNDPPAGISRPAIPDALPASQPPGTQVPF